MQNRQLSLKTILLTALIIGSLVLGTEVRAQDPIITIDGDIGDDEYSFELSFEDGLFLLYWEVVEEQIYFAITAKTTGYVGINIAPGIILNDADLYYGFVNELGDFMVDTYSHSTFGPTKPDIDDGGTDDILEYSGNEIAGYTTFEFRRLLETGDSSHDNKISLGKTKIAWTTGPSDDIGDRPAESGRVEINFITGDSKEVKDWGIYYIIGGIVVGIIGIILLGRYLWKRRSRISAEKD
ncbi:MAG: DOMON domain-containing protein [Candidatus Kariarchaeaceae archaeon]|jgi:hypothetical protein